MTRTQSLTCVASAIALGALVSCSLPPMDMEADMGADADMAVDVGQAAVAGTQSFWDHATGKNLFKQPFPGTNGRSCATCHTLDEHTTLFPESVQARLAANPSDPLFHRIDADDPDAEVLTFEHLEKGLVRVVLPLPDNMDVIDVDGNVITPADRQVFVWRGVPSVQNTKITGPFLYDGRAVTLQEQAQAAISSHSEGGPVARAHLDLIARFQQGLFTSLRALFVAELLADGVPLDEIPIPEDYMWLNPQERRGRDVYRAACELCHGLATTSDISNRDVLQFPVVKPDGNVLFTVIPGQGPVPVFESRPDARFINAGFSGFSYFGQLGQFPTFNASVELPRYRFRFYADGTRQQAIADLPPIPVTASGAPFDPNPALDENGAPIVGPNFFPQWFTTDPGRALITGDPLDFEGFDVPALRGVARTPPYFHDNSHATLQDAVDTYSRFIIPFVAVLNLPPVHPPEFPGSVPESLSPAQKQDLLAFLNRL